MSGSVFSKKNNKIMKGLIRINVDRMKFIIYEIFKEKVFEMVRKIVMDVFLIILVKNSI